MAAGASSVLGDAITTLSKATLAIASAEDQARRDVAKAASEADAFRRERDAARNALSASQKETNAHKLNAETWKAKVEQANLNLKHLRELADGARREADQWKEQCLRSEKTRANQEESLLAQIDEWREQCRRVEKERSRLSTKLEELLLRQTRTQTPHTPQQTHTDEPAASTSSTTTKVSKLHPPQSSGDTHRSLTAVEDREQPRRKAPRRSTPARPRRRPHVVEDDDDVPPAKPSRTHASSVRRSIATEPRETRLIRRVHAVISVPVKQEDDGPLGVESGGLFDSGMTDPVGSRSLSASSTHHLPGHTAQTKSGRVVRPAPNRLSRDGGYAEDAYAYEEDDTGDKGRTYVGDGDNDGDGDYDEHERVRGQKKRRREPESRTRRRSVVVEEDDEGDDELMIGAEEDHDAVYGSSRIDGGSASTAKTSRRTSHRAPAPSKAASGTKRKNSSVVASGERPPVHKAKR